MLNKYLFTNKEVLKSTRDAFGEALLDLAKTNQDIVVVSADLAESTRVHKFAKKYPKRFFEVGVAEQNMLGVAAGLALSNKIPFAASFAAFSPGRNWDQLRVSICYSKANVKIVSTHSGLAVGPDGASHQALEDIAITRCLPNLTVIAPIDYEQTKKAVKAITRLTGPIYLRLTRQNSPVITTAQTPFQIGKANILQAGKDITLIGCGPILYEALTAARELKKQNISVEIIDLHTIKPLDATTILRSVKKTKKIITLEEHQVAGGLGSAVVEMLAQKYPVPTQIIGVQDRFGESGQTNELWKKYKLNREYIKQSILTMMKNKV
ncbi:transketolase family protein [bacterium]|jgi:transketolase|nr:transketolase family protein [bacterium]MBT4649340.1 transketolase family protein [bacterium]